MSNPQSAILNPQSAAAQPPEGWLSTEQAAAHLGCTDRSVRRQCADGFLQAIQVGAVWHVSPAAHPALKIAMGDFSTGPTAAGIGLADLSADQRGRAFSRLTMIRNYLDAAENKPASMSLGEFQCRWVETWNALGVMEGKPDARTSRSSLLRWLKKYDEQGVIGLIDTRGGFRSPDLFSPEAKEFLLGLYLSQHEPSVPYIYTLAAGQARERGWRLPGMRTVQRFLLDRTDPKLITAGRDPKTFRNRCTPFVKRDWTLVGAMECWVADHRQFDVLLPRVMWNKDKHREEVKWFRPWLTAYLDCRSWQLVGRVIDFDSPDADRVMGAFGAGVAEYGAPEHAILDNGKDFRAHDFAGGRIRKVRKGEKYLDQKRVEPMLETLGVTPHWAIPYNAKAKIIEPFFRILSEQFDKLWPTYFGRSPENRPEKIAKLRAEQVDMSKLNIDIFRRAFDRWAEIYALAPSPAVAAGGRCPARAIAELRRPGREPIRPAAETIALLQSRSKRIQVRANGVFVAAFNRYYWSNELEDRRAASGRDIRRHVVYRYRPGEPDGVYIFDFTTDRFICFATPYIGDGVHPLASSDADREQLADAMALQRGLACRTRAEVKRLKMSSAEVLLEGIAKGLSARGMLDDPNTIKLPAASKTIKLIGDGEIDRAAQAGRVKRLTREQERKTAAEFYAVAATGTDCVSPVRRLAVDPLAAISFNPQSAIRNPQSNKGSGHANERKHEHEPGHVA